MLRNMDSKITRLFVFNYMKRVMTMEGRVPTSGEVGSVVGITQQTANRHMRALDGADGLPLPIPTRDDRNADCQSHLRGACALGGFRRGYRVDTNLLPLDVLINA
jgi:hypothetical protein